MKLRTLFFILATLLIMAGCVLLKISAELDKVMFYAAEGFLFACLCFIIYFYYKIIKTLNTLANGMELLNEQDFNSRLSPVGQYDADRIVEVFNRMMTQLKTESLRLREQGHFLDLIINSSPMGVIILDFDEKITSVNKAALNFLSYNSETEILNKHIESLSSPLASRLNSIQKETTETLRIGDAMIYRCSRLSFLDRGFHHPFILIESLTSEVMKAEKKAYEKVIRMIAHEVNNSVAGVTSTLDAVNEALTGIENAADLKEAMCVCIERCYGMSNFITRFADVVKIPEPTLNREDLNQCIARCKTLMEGICLERGIKLDLNLHSSPINIMIDSTLIEHVIVNIIKNSAESIVHNGIIKIETSANPSPMIEITDNGTGIDSDTADKLFTPFFSTKPNGQGLGLIFIREVLLKHNCQFSLRTYGDGLTRFIIRFN